MIKKYSVITYLTEEKDNSGKEIHEDIIEANNEKEAEQKFNEINNEDNIWTILDVKEYNENINCININEDDDNEYEEDNKDDNEDDNNDSSMFFLNTENQNDRDEKLDDIYTRATNNDE